jgi:hypothetical protein
VGWTLPPSGFLLGLACLPPLGLFLPLLLLPGLPLLSSMATFLMPRLSPALLALIPMVWMSLYLQWGVPSLGATGVPPHSLGGIHIFMEDSVKTFQLSLFRFDRQSLAYVHFSWGDFIGSALFHSWWRQSVSSLPISWGLSPCACICGIFAHFCGSSAAPFDA